MARLNLEKWRTDPFPAPRATVTVGTRKKINGVRKSRVK
jgi:hypothetical protein